MGDAVVIYDQLSGRWIAAQSAVQSIVNGPYFYCMAVSSTSNPMGSWCSYQFQVHNTKFPDYPKLGLWSSQNAYFMTAAQFTRGSTFAGIGVYAFQRDQMIGCRSARFAYRDMYSVDANLPRLMPADVDGFRAPPAGAAAPILAMNWTGSPNTPNALQVWNGTVDWSSTPSLSMTHAADLTTAAYNTSLCGYSRACVAQPGTTARVDPISDRLMYRLGYRNFGSHQAMVVNHTVNAGNDQAAIRWYQLTKATGAWQIGQQGTYAPDSTSRFMGSAAMDGAGNVAVGYSVSDGVSTYPGVRYAGRLATDPAGQLAQGERTLVTGSGVQTQASSHWGDYSMMSVDPNDDCTFWYAQEYYAKTGTAAWRTHIGSFRFPSCASSPRPTN